MLQRHVDFLLSQPTIYFGKTSPLEEDDKDIEEFCGMHFEQNIQTPVQQHIGLCIHWYEYDVPKWNFLEKN